MPPTGGSGDDGSLGVGLNYRRDGGAMKKKNKKANGRSVLDGSSDDSDDERCGGSKGVVGTSMISGRGEVNRDIVAEQEALRQRAEKAYAGVFSRGDGAGGVFDYDGGYDDFSSAARARRDEASRARDTDGRRKESRYVSNLLKTAEVRQREREVVEERRIARENAANADNEEYQGKEKFVTKAYRRKLEERERWEEEQRRGDRKADAGIGAEGGKAGEGFGMMGGSAGLLRNVTAPGGRRENVDVDSQRQTRQPDRYGDHEEVGERQGDIDGRNAFPQENLHNMKSFQNLDRRPTHALTDKRHRVEEDDSKVEQTNGTPTVESTRDRRRCIVKEARARYLDRKRRRQAGELDFRPLVV
mmetsp:Transcript_12355/g.36284  ORF Transcript_12355/g.36284 Transcript_12355/m.36284 type:complete len:359 (-) Transcript_12355:188-1264(-)